MADGTLYGPPAPADQETEVSPVGQPLSDPFHYHRQTWVAAWAVLIGGLLGAFVSWWFPVVIAVGMMVTSLVGVIKTSREEGGDA